VDDGNQQVRRQRLPGLRMREFGTADQHRAIGASAWGLDTWCFQRPAPGRDSAWLRLGSGLGSILAVLEAAGIGKEAGSVAERLRGGRLTRVQEEMRA
jgi:hypothetical protein